MIETLLVLLAVGLVSGVAFAAAVVPPWTILQAGAAVTALGLLLGVPTGFWYHVALYRTLRPRGPLPSRWWLHPVPLHDALEEAERPRVLRWFVAGGAGFVLVVLGIGVVLLGILVAAFAARG